MEQQKITPEKIYKLAEKMATYFLVRNGLSHRHHAIEDAAQEIALAGFQNLKETNEIDKIKKRMRDRLKTWWGRFCARESKQPIPESTRHKPETDDEDESNGYDVPRLGRQGEKYQEIDVLEFVEKSLTHRQQGIVRFTAAGFSNIEIAAELGISTRTIERERDEIKEKYKREFNRRETLLKFRSTQK